MDSSQDKDLPATDRRLEQARSEGQVARSKDLVNVAVLGGGFLLLVNFFPWAMARMIDGLRWQLRFDHESLKKSDVLTRHLETTILDSLGVVLPFCLALLAISVGASIAAGGWTASLKPLMPDFSKVNPMSGLGRLFSKKQLVDVIKLVVVASAVATVGWLYVSSHFAEVAGMSRMSLQDALSLLGGLLMRVMGLMMLVLVAVAVMDVPLALFLHKQQLKMSHQDVKQEHKESEGNPQIKGRMRSLQRQAANRRSIAAVPKADLVVMNPTHYAVAIRYDEATMRAPRVIAKGTDLVAMRIRDVAKGHKIPVLQSPMLARALYAHSEMDAEIPPALYTAVAQVLAYVYQVKAALSGRGVMPVVQPEPYVPAELDPHHPKGMRRHDHSEEEV